MRRKAICLWLTGIILGLAGCGTERVTAENRDAIVAGDYYIAVTDDDGDIHIAYETDRECYDITNSSWGEVDKWMKNAAFPVGISVEGGLIFPKGQSYEELLAAEKKKQEELPLGAVYGEGHVADLYAAEQMQMWNSIQMVAGTYPGCVLGIKKDGSVCEAGITEIAGSIEDVLAWTNMVDVAILYNGEEIVGLDKEGNVYTKGIEDVVWTDVKEIEAGNTMIFGLREDGSVVHTEYPLAKDYSTDAMQDIAAIAVGYDAEAALDVVYGIREDGKVMDRFGQEMTGFTNMLEIDVTTVNGIIIGRNTEDQLVISQDADENLRKLVEEYNQK